MNKEEILKLHPTACPIALEKGYLSTGKGVRESTLRNSIWNLRIAQDAVQKAQEETRRLGIPNWYQINGEIISDIQIAEAAKQNKKGNKLPRNSISTCTISKTVRNIPFGLFL
jgi:hypothetical protein